MNTKKEVLRACRLQNRYGYKLVSRSFSNCKQATRTSGYIGVHLPTLHILSWIQEVVNEVLDEAIAETASCSSISNANSALTLLLQLMMILIEFLSIKKEF